MPAPGRGFSRQLQRVLIKARSIRRPDKLAAHLLVGTTHLDTHRLWLDRVGVAVAQQGIEQHGFAGAIQITRAKHKKLQRVRLRPANVELGQIQRRSIQAQHAGLVALTRHQHFRLGRQRQFGVPLLVGLALGQHLALAVQQFQLHAGQGTATFQRLGEHIQTFLITMHGKADIAKGEQRGGRRIVVTAGRLHHCQVNTRLLQRLDPGSRQDQGLTGIARRVQVKAPAIHQISHAQQVLGFVALQGAVAAPLAEERRQRLGFDPEELDIHFVDVQRDHRQTFGQAGGQQVAATGKADSGLQVTGFQAADVLGGEGGAVDCAQAGVDGEDQFALRFQMAQMQFHQVVRQFPGAIDLAGFGVDQVQFVGEVLLRVQRHRKADGQGAGSVQLHFGYIHHTQLAPGIALGQHLYVLYRSGRLRVDSRRCHGFAGGR